MARLIDKATFVAEDDDPWTIAIYGDWGVGKTVLACQAPHVLHVDTERSRKSLLNHPDLVRTPSVKVKTFEDVEKLAWDLRDNTHPLAQQTETVIIDTWSTLQQRELDGQLRDAQKNNKSAEVSEYKYRINNDRMRQLLLLLIEGNNKNIILLNHIKEEKDDEGQTILIRPGTSPRTTDNMGSLVDAVFYLSGKANSKGEVTRTLQTLPTGKIRAKNRFSSTLPFEIASPTWDKIQVAIDEQRQIAKKLLDEQEMSNA